MPINKKRKLGPKTVDIFLGYAHRSTANQFLVVKSDVPDVYVDTIMEFRDATFFENVFPMKDMHSTLKFSSKLIPKPVTPVESFKRPPVNIQEEDDNAVLRKSKRPRVEKFFGDDFIVYLWMIPPRPLQKHMHPQMQMIGRKLSRMRWTRFFPMGLGR